MKLLFIITGILFCAVTYAQDTIKVMGMRPDTNTDTTITIQTICKENGDALLVIFSKIKDLRISSTGKIALSSYEPEKNKYMVCMQPNVTHILTLSHPDFADKKYYMGQLESGQVYQYIVNPIMPPPPPPSDMLLGDYYLNSVPEGADIIIEGIPSFHEKTPFTFKGYTARTYNVELQLENYNPVKTQININPTTATPTTISLTPKTGFLDVNADNEAATGATIILDGERIGRVPMQHYQLQQRRYSLLIEKNGFSSFQRNVDIYDKQTSSIPVRLLLTKRVFIYAGAPKTYIYVDGKYIGKSPVDYKMNLGRHSIKAMKEDYSSDSTVIDLQENTPDDQHVELNNIKLLTYKVYIKPTPAASISVDGVHVKDSSGYIEVPRGHHAFKLTRRGYFPRTVYRNITSYKNTGIYKTMYPRSLVNLTALYDLNSWGGEFGFTAGHFSLGLDLFPKMKNTLYKEPSTDLPVVYKDDNMPLTEMTDRVPAKDSTGLAGAIKIGASFGWPVPFRVHIGYAIRKVYFNKTYMAANNFRYYNSNGEQIQILEGDQVRGYETEHEQLNYYIAGLEVAVLRRINLLADYWYNKQQSNLILGLGINFY